MVSNSEKRHRRRTGNVNGISIPCKSSKVNTVTFAGGGHLPPITGEYKKKTFVDYDVIICIPSRERYEKVTRMISQYYDQPTKYTFKIILLNDGSSTKDYKQIIKKFPKICYLENLIPNGKIRHWRCYNQMWKQIKNMSCHVILQSDDDFILSDNFLDNVIDLFFEEKKKNNRVMAIAPHLWATTESCENQDWWHKRDCFVDGLGVIDEAVIKHMKYKMVETNYEMVKKINSSVMTWSQISNAIDKMKGFVHKTPNSLVYHDGIYDSKLHPEHRKNNNQKIYTQKYIGEL